MQQRDSCTSAVAQIQAIRIAVVYNIVLDKKTDHSREE